MKGYGCFVRNKSIQTYVQQPGALHRVFAFGILRYPSSGLDFSLHWGRTLVIFLEFEDILYFSCLEKIQILCFIAFGQLRSLCHMNPHVFLFFFFAPALCCERGNKLGKVKYLSPLALEMK